MLYKPKMVKKLRTAGITATGSYVPEKVVTNQDIVERGVDTSDEWIYEKIGIRERRFVTDEETSDLAANAAENLLKTNGISREDLDMIIVATGTPDMMSPSTACIVQDKLKAKNASAFDVSNACSGFNYALDIGSKYVADGSCNNILVIGAEVNSRILDWEDRTTCVYFGDGAGAVLLKPVKEGYGLLGSCFGADGSRRDLLNASKEGIRMNGKKVWDFVVDVFPNTVREVLRKCNLKTDDIDLLIAHQANINLIEHGMRELGLTMDKTHTTIREYGNTVGASIPLSLDSAMKEGRIKGGNIVVLVGFGAGFAWGANVLRWGEG